MFDVLLDSSDIYLSIGLAEDGVLIDSIHYEAWQMQSEKMIPELQHILQKNHVKREQIQSFAVGKGPGSYTGVRIAMTIAKVGATSLHVPLYLISSLEMMKDEKELSICLMNARSKRSYVGIYQGDQVIRKEGIMTNEQVLTYINEHPNAVVIGDTEYLGILGRKSEVLQGMLRMMEKCPPCENPLSASPVYMKDEV